MIETMKIITISAKMVMIIIMLEKIMMTMIMTILMMIFYACGDG